MDRAEHRDEPCCFDGFRPVHRELRRFAWELAVYRR